MGRAGAGPTYIVEEVSNFEDQLAKDGQPVAVEQACGRAPGLREGRVLRVSEAVAQGSQRSSLPSPRRFPQTPSELGPGLGRGAGTPSRFRGSGTRCATLSTH